MNNKAEILILTGVKDKPIATFQYETGSKLFNTMLTRFRRWESEGKLSIVDVRKAEYLI